MARPVNYEKYAHLIGTILNGWKIVDIKTYDDRHCTYALAQCKCGNVIETPLTHINTGKIVDCGCGRKRRMYDAILLKYQHLIGQHINGWSVMEILPKYIDGHTFALCRCRCGTEKPVRLTYLLNGRSKDCGCGRKETLRETRTNNLVGHRFGKLTVIQLLDKSDKFGRRMYRCKCDCGNETIVSSVSLVTEHTNSCGCLNSYYNMKIHKFMEEQNISHQTEYSIQIGDRRYRFDFYLPDYNLCIEYDGVQHFEPKGFGADEFTAQQRFHELQERDRAKDDYCHANNIHLLRIPYWDAKNLKTIISNCLQRLTEGDFVA